MLKKYTALTSCITGELPPGNPNATTEVYLASDIDGTARMIDPDGMGLSHAQLAQLRDLLRCIAWIRDLQLTSDPKNFDLGELFRDLNVAYCAHQLMTATELYRQLDDYCEANQIPPMQWKMK